MRKKITYFCDGLKNLAHFSFSQTFFKVKNKLNLSKNYLQLKNIKLGEPGLFVKLFDYSIFCSHFLKSCLYLISSFQSFGMIYESITNAQFWRLNLKFKTYLLNMFLDHDANSKFCSPHCGHFWRTRFTYMHKDCIGKKLVCFELQTISQGLQKVLRKYEKKTSTLHSPIKK